MRDRLSRWLLILEKFQLFIKEIVTKIASEDKNWTIRMHAGENDSLKSNMAKAISLVEESLLPGQAFPYMRIGHGLYCAKLSSRQGKALLAGIKAHQIVLEFQLTSNVRLNNIIDLTTHPLKSYLHHGISCVMGTDGYGLYGTDSIDEQLALETTDNWYEASSNGEAYTVEVYADNEAYVFSVPIMKELTEQAFEELPVYYTIISFNEDQLKMRAKLNEVWLQYVPSFITGAKSIEAEWDDYVAAYKAAGSDEITKALNDAVSVAEANYNKYTQ